MLGSRDESADSCSSALHPGRLDAAQCAIAYAGNVSGSLADAGLARAASDCAHESMRDQTVADFTD
jgi:hypothetical protein